MSKAAVIVQNLLELHAGNDQLRHQAGTYANQWVGLIYDRKPQMMNGQFGVKPHKLTTAAYALATGLAEVDHLKSVQAAAIAGLSTIMADITINRRLYGFNRTDEVLLELADAALMSTMSNGAMEAEPEALATTLKFRQPEMPFAARGFATVAIARFDKVPVDLNAMADQYADSMRREGCSEVSALSAQWGGVTSMVADLNLYGSYIHSYVETMNESSLPIPTDRKHPKNKFNMGASLYIALVMTEAPNEFERFLEYMGRPELCAV